MKLANKTPNRNQKRLNLSLASVLIACHEYDHNWMNNKDEFTCRTKNLELLSQRSNLKRVHIFVAVDFYHQHCSAKQLG